MTKSRKNRWIDWALLLFLCLTVLSLGGPRSDHGLSIKTYVHASSGCLLTLGVFVHLALHRHSLRLALARRVTKMKARRVVYGWLALFVLVAFFSGFAEIASTDVNLLHHVVGLLAFFGLAGHTVRRLTFMRMWPNSAPLNRPRTVRSVSSSP